MNYSLLAEERIREAADIPNLLSTSINVVVSRAKGIFTFWYFGRAKDDSI
jgi:hypothetical protein